MNRKNIVFFISILFFTARADLQSVCGSILARMQHGTIGNTYKKTHAHAKISIYLIISILT